MAAHVGPDVFRTSDLFSIGTFHRTEADHVTGLIWWPERGYGYQPLGPEPVEYGAAYWDRYQGYLGTPMEEALNAVRTGLVNAYLEDGILLDVGVGNLSFLEAMGGIRSPVCGYDVNPAAQVQLRERHMWATPTDALWTAMTMWDVLEHLERPELELVLACCARWLFISMPTYRDAAHVLASKHHRPGEHCWYFTERGLVTFLEGYGFRCRFLGHPETLAGRESVTTFVFERITARPLEE